ncbi:heterokaryon incompatibility domain-containing protein [Trichoderma longibrachiatum]|uniref:HET-domain-containing protein n=1 Tax=Trichoderma longibrachiatum ATCC 18648 TaxID=983965 RepID=A0A2T4BPJ0_TRILO|nr:HET-domain-containing protein [Trichoderma longibrachiatum ATCC 18648]
MLDKLKALVHKKEKQWCGACLFELPPTAKSLPSDISGRYEYAFAESDSHDFTPALLANSSERGCDRCTALASALEKLGVADFKEASWQPNLNSPGSPTLEITDANDALHVFELCSSEAPLEEPAFFTDDAPPHAVLCRGYKISRTTGDDEALDQAAKWLKNCQAHEKCQVEHAGFVPTRLLYLGPERTDTDVLDLVENMESVPYAALSHRWTDETPSISLLTTNLSARRQHGMPIVSLPRMMQDVVLVLRHLGIEYVWIDSLCIVQDDKEDWKREAAKMALIYTNAELTVAASWCDKPRQSLFKDRREPRELPVDLAEVKGQSIFIRRRKPHLTWSEEPMVEDPDTEWPLLSRGWVYQEQLLSRRMLHFTRNELIWECLETTQCECGWYDSIMRHQSTRDSLKQSAAEKAWVEIIQGYAKRPLTVIADRLPALAGIGKAMAAVRGYDSAEYLCGIWEKELEESLFWYLTEPPREKPDIGLPSWSWASVVGDVECWQLSLEDIEFLGSDVAYAGDALMGDMVSGQLSLSGYVASGVVYHGQEWADMVEARQQDGSGILTSEGATDEFGLKLGEQFATFSPDYRLDVHVASGSQVVCLLFGRNSFIEVDDGGESVETVTSYILILRPLDGTPLRYERIGVCRECVELDVFMRRAERQQLTVV